MVAGTSAAFTISESCSYPVTYVEEGWYTPLRRKIRMWGTDCGRGLLLRPRGSQSSWKLKDVQNQNNFSYDS